MSQFGSLQYSQREGFTQDCNYKQINLCKLGPMTLCACAWASYQIRKMWFAYAPGKQGMFFPPPRVSDPDMYHVMMHAGIANKWFPLMSVVGQTFLAFPVHVQPAILPTCMSAGCNGTTINLLHKSHNALVPYHIMQHFVTEMCTCVYI